MAIRLTKKAAPRRKSISNLYFPDSLQEQSRLVLHSLYYGIHFLCS